MKMRPVITGLFLTFSWVCHADWNPAPSPLKTRWAKEVSPTNSLPEYPRPQMERKAWQSLNGLWDYALTPTGTTKAPADYSKKILVPFPYESSLSGIGKPSPTDQRLWYHRSFDIPGDWKGQKVILHFGAVNWECTVAVNGLQVGAHRGGYDGFDFDITDVLKSGSNDLVVMARNPLLHDVPNAQAIGKQRSNPSGVFYTAATGIWQTVWLEPVPVAHIEGLKITPNIDQGKLEVGVECVAASAAKIQVTVKDETSVVAETTGVTGSLFDLAIPSPHLWSPSDPHLYDIVVKLVVNNQVVDQVKSYAGLRKVSLGKDKNGHTCIFLNNEFLFEVGVLDQGYWPDGIYTAPTDEALRYDIEVAKQFNFNLIRKHAKVEPDRWYYWTDKLGMLVWQDMPQMFGKGVDFTDETKQEFLTEWTRIITQRYNHPSIIVWTPFNEDWGQHDTEAIAAQTKKLDPTRLVNAASGGYNVYHDGKRSPYREDTPPGIGDIQDEHSYPDVPHVKPDETRAAVAGEFGGVTMTVKSHDWAKKVFGYGSILRGRWFFTKRYQELLKEAWRIKEKSGTSAIVYTQIVDVEQELNGLVTYDREVIKPNADVIVAANQGQFPAMSPNPNYLVTPTSERSPINWKYTTDRPNDDWSDFYFNDEMWKSAPAPFGHGYASIRTPWTTDDIWMRRTFCLPVGFSQSISALEIDDDNAEVYLNGVLGAEFRAMHDHYTLCAIKPEALAVLKPGLNIIAVHCHQTVGGQIIDVGLTQDDQ